MFPKMVMAPYCSEPIGYEILLSYIISNILWQNASQAQHILKKANYNMAHRIPAPAKSPEKGLAEECIQAENYTKQRRQSFRFKVPHLTLQKAEHTVFG